MLSRRGPKQGGGVWEDPGNYNSRLSALTWTAQVLIFDQVCREAGSRETQIPILLRNTCQEFFQQAAETPFGYILQWRLYLFKVSKSTITSKQAIWNLSGDTITYDGTQLTMAHIKQLVSSQYHLASDILQSELLLGAENLPYLDLGTLHDDLDLIRHGASWVEHHDNEVVLSKAHYALLERIHANAPFKDMFITSVSNQPPQLCPKRIALYEAQVQKFLSALLVLCHITPGPPMREHELLSITWKNTERRRHIFLWSKHVIIHSQYHKGQQQSGNYKENIRFLPHAIGRLFIQYIAFVIPLRQLFLWQSSPGTQISPYLWAQPDNKPWSDGTISNKLRSACKVAGIPGFQVAWWRQVAASITKEKFSPREHQYFDNNHDIDEDIDDESLLVALAEQSNHTYRTMNHLYAGNNTLTMDYLLKRSYHASTSWHVFFGFDRLQAKRPRSEGQDSVLLASSKRLRHRVRTGVSEQDLLSIARQVERNPDLQFRGPGQRNAILAVMGFQYAKQALLILGTGAGKTLLIMISAALEPESTTILVIPTVALRTSMQQRFLDVGIEPQIWSSTRQSPSSLVIVSAEAACSTAFADFCFGLVQQQRLARIFVDEAHLTLTASEYRPKMRELGPSIARISAQTVWMTATLPPVMEEEFKLQNILVRPRTVRESTDRPKTRYRVFRTPTENLVDSLICSLHLFLKPLKTARDKAIIYCRTKDAAVALASGINSPSYTADSGDEEEKRAIIHSWLSNPERPCIVATTALGPGFHYPHIPVIIHLDAPTNMTDFAQESGRAGRNGTPCTSFILIRETWKPNRDMALPPDQEAMQLYLASQFCLRGCLSQFLDSEPYWLWCSDGPYTCSVCMKQGYHSDPRRPTDRFSFPPDPVTTYPGPQRLLDTERAKFTVLERYTDELQLHLGTCLYCRVFERDFQHPSDSCVYKWDWYNAKKMAITAARNSPRKYWIKSYVACFMCLQPQSICRRAEDGTTKCQFPDLILPLCYGLYKYNAQLLATNFEQRLWKTEVDFILWLGEATSLAGTPCIRANCVAEKTLPGFV